MGTDKGKLRGSRGAHILLAGILAVGLWHGLDVRDGAAHTGNRWLYGWYLAAFLWGMGLLALSGWLLIWKKCSLERAFVVCSLGLGLLFTAVLPRCPRRTRWPTISPPTRCPTG